jgi:hypothetical protein
MVNSLKTLKILTLSLLMIHANTVLLAGELHLDSERNTRTLRFEIDNDLVWNDDSGFTNGWSLQYHSVRSASWDNADTMGWIKWIGNHFGTLHDDDALVRTCHGVGQNMITPGDIQAKIPQDDDLPYAGTLTYTLSWQNFNRRKAANFQISAGVLGKESLAEQFQKLVHNELGLGEEPNGWDTQRDTEPILNVGYQYAWSPVNFGRYNNGWATQVTVAPSASLGNLFTAAEVFVAIRIGWNMLEGFNSYPAPPGRGFFQASYLAKPESASPHGVELVLGGRCTGLLYSVIYDGSLITGDDRDVDRNNFYFAAGVGLYYHYYDCLSIRATIQRATDLIDSESIPNPLPGREKTDPDISYGSLMIDIHF